LTLRQRSFKADEISYLDRKSIQLDRMLLKLFELLRFDGRPVVRARRKVIDIDSLVALMQANPERFPGFNDYPEVARAWLKSNLLEIMRRGRTGQETVVGPRPFHLNAFKLINPKAAQDYGASTQVWAMLYHADPTLLERLKEFFGKGLDTTSDQYDGTTVLDIETLAVLSLCDQVPVYTATTRVPEPVRPLCLRQGRLLSDDLRRLLAYEDVVPRHVLAGYVRTVIGLHLSLYMLRLLRLLPDWVSVAERNAPASACNVDEGPTHNEGVCPFDAEIVVDLTDDRTSPSAALAGASAAEHFDRIPGYVRAVVLINRLKEFAAVQTAASKRAPARTAQDLLAILQQPPSEMDGFFAARIADVLTLDRDEEEDPAVLAVLQMEDLSPLQQYVELVCMQVMKVERKRVVDLLDSLTQKNRSGGLLRQSAGARSQRWFALGSGLLETLIQIAVIERDPDGAVRSRNLLLDEFEEWLRTRYGLVIYAPAHRDVPPEEQEGWRLNELALRQRLHQIGFFIDLSDAYNSQTLRPRYQVCTSA